ncbi:30S ribosomal protein S3 [Candidatus Curtissbacteria bacterium]|nr:30S ribosomal protein S3 [Candidatus Curtissbacteria bacterium]
MGQKVHPISFRTGINKDWSSRWFSRDADYKNLLAEDRATREFLDIRLKPAGLSKIEIERSFDKRTITVFVSRPGIVIGRGGTGLEETKKQLMKKLKLKDEGKMEFRVEEIKNPDLDAKLIAISCAEQLAKRIPHKRVIGSSLERIQRSGAKGGKIILSGRLGGAEIARKESGKFGSIPLQTIKADIDFASIGAPTKAGLVGVKVWIFRGQENQ